MLVCLCSLLVVASTLAARAASSPRTVLPDGSVRYEYGRRPTPELSCKPHYVCDITLDAGENVLNMAIGDATRWVIASGSSGPGGTIPHVFVKPTQAGLDTNLVITTSRRVYDVGLRSANDARCSRISFFYADEDAAAKAALAQQQRLAIASVLAGTPLQSPDQADSKYKLEGEPALLPSSVFNDGVRTFIEWKTLPSELPAVVAIGKDGAAVPMNVRIVGNRYIIDSVDPAYDLVLGAGDRHGRAQRRASIRHL
jgi:type IV secretion system protein VirB9